MATTLVVVRHAKPQSDSVDGTDFARELTTQGLAAVEASFPTTFALLGDALDDAQLWSSPAVRAQQTAEALAAAIDWDADAIQEHDSIYAQDENAFLDEVVAASAQTVIAVGHIPMMENLVADLAGVELDFKPGAAAALEITRAIDDFQPAKLLWFVQGPKVED